MISKSGVSVYRDCTPIVDSWFDVAEQDALTPALVGAVAEAAGVDATALPPLLDSVDLDALSLLFERRTGGGLGETLFSFVVDDLAVFVRGDGRIRVCDTTRQVAPEPVFDSAVR